MRRSHRSERWAIILAGGEGERMSGFTRSRYGERRPKQYCSFMGGQSMFRHTMRRALDIVGHRRVVTVIGKGHFQFIDQGAVSGIFVEQPQNRGTAPGIFLPLCYIMAYDPEATVLVFPSDHFIHPNRLFVSFMKDAAELVEGPEDRLVLAAAVADRPETEYGWIQPGDPIGDRTGPSNILRFCEKPNELEAVRFHRQGYLWNTLNMAVKAKMLWSIGWELYPVMMDAFEVLKSAIGTSEEASTLGAIYERMQSLDFSKDILEHCADRSLVLPMNGVEWSDWGRPERVQETLGRRLAVASSTSSV